MVDVTDCEKEPIHIPGLIQPHGMLFVLSKPDLMIEQVSENVQEFLGLRPDKILNTPFLDFVQESLSPTDIKRIFKEQRSTKYLSILNNRDIRIVRFELIVHEHDDCLIAELDPMEEERFDLHSVFNGVSAAITEMQKTKDLIQLCQKATDEVSRLTGYDRVMIYRFDENWNGNVVAETLANSKVDSYRNHWFPSSDIPAQARAMLAENWLRSIPTVNFKPSRIVPLINPRTKRPLNLGKSIFRSPSPIHLEYLRNMNVGGTLTISIMQDEKLWGLIACHHGDVKPIKHDERVACQFIGQIVSTMVSSREVIEDLKYAKKIDGVFDKLLKHMSSSNDFLAGLVEHKPNLLDLTAAEGAAAAVYYEGEWVVLGETPTIAQINGLTEWIAENHGDEGVFHTDRLPLLYPPAKRFKSIAAGVLAISIMRGRKNYILWFRPEVTQIVTWAGAPQKSVELEKGTLSLHPRKSFEAWKEVRKNHSHPWKPCELEAAKNLRRAVIEFDLTRQFKRFHELSDSMDQIVWTANDDGHVDYYNKRWYELTGLKKEIFSESVREKVLHPEDMPRVTKQWQESLKKKKTFASRHRIKDSDGKYRWFALKAVPVKDRGGKVLKWYGSGTEIEAPQS